MSNTILTYDSYQLTNGKWIPRAKEAQFSQENMGSRTYTWADETFDSKEEADAFARMKMEQQAAQER